ncbi:MAG: hypothetical protein E7652_04095 [Ruminococcaceae bacterium]|nr:hypothetical protein [Oscillospiraceae bacterium]
MMVAFRRSILTFIITFCIAMLVFSVIGYALMEKYLPDEKDDGKKEKETILETLDEALNPDSTPTEQIKKQVDAETFTLLLVGNDYQSDIKHSYADSILLVHFSCETGQVVYLPIPGNLRVKKNMKDTDLASIYNDTNPSGTRNTDKLVDEIETKLNIEIDHYLCTSLAANSLARVVDKVGSVSGSSGIEYKVPYDMEKSDEVKGFIDLEKGTQMLSGKEATSMLRYIGGTSDEDYAERRDLNSRFMATLIETIFRKFGDAEIMTMYDEFVGGGSVKSDITNINDETVLSHLDTVTQYEKFTEVFLDYPGEIKTFTDESTKKNRKYFEVDNESLATLLDDYGFKKKVQE